MFRKLSKRQLRKLYKRHFLKFCFSVLIFFVIINMIGYHYYYALTSLKVDVEDMANAKSINSSFSSNTLPHFPYRLNDTFNGLRFKFSLTSEDWSLPFCDTFVMKFVSQYQFTMVERTWSEVRARHLMVNNGHWRPSFCRARNRVAIIIPFRARDKHLRILLNNLHNLLQLQLCDYSIILVEQLPGSKFNRAMLFNIGFLESLKLNRFNCFIFHDVDLIPENGWNLYSCSDNPLHLSAYVDKFNYKLPYENIFGGVSAMSRDQVLKVNGFSNLYFGWGGEDDDMSKRLRHVGFKLGRYPPGIGRYHMIKHVGDKGNPVNPLRNALYREAEIRMPVDGLNNIHYELVNVSVPEHGLVVWYQVRINQRLYMDQYNRYFAKESSYELRLALFVMALVVIVMMCAMAVVIYMSIHCCNTDDNVTTFHKQNRV